MSNANSTPASRMSGPPAPKKRGSGDAGSGSLSPGAGGAARVSVGATARPSPAASESPLGSPAMIMMALGFTQARAIAVRLLGGALDLARDFEREVERLLGRLSAHQRRLAGAHASDKVLQLQFERLFFCNWHGLPPAA